MFNFTQTGKLRRKYVGKAKIDVFNETFVRLVQDYQKFSHKIQDFGHQQNHMQIEFKEAVEYKVRKDLQCKTLLVEEQGKVEEDKKQDQGKYTLDLMNFKIDEYEYTQPKAQFDLELTIQFECFEPIRTIDTQTEGIENILQTYRFKSV